MLYMGKNGELNFEKDFINELTTVGWEKEILKNYNEEDLINNWKNIIFDNNKGMNKLNGVELSKNEMNQILTYINTKCTNPIDANIFINGKNIPITRDIDSKDELHAGKIVYLDIFSPAEIAGGRTRYQIAEQINFKTSKQYNDRRGDIMLLINGMPLIHIELKANGEKVESATNQIQKYAKEGVFKGIFSLIQVFFAITPDDAVYFANPGAYKNFNESFFFHWGNKQNEPVKNWKLLCKGDCSLLSIPEAHKLIGYYVVADKNKGVLKVARSYQYHAINAILHRVKKQIWSSHKPLGGYVWCTTGGGKTMTSFKAGQIIIDTGAADKVIFVVDRVELNTQSLDEYNSFARVGCEVQGTGTTAELFKKLKSSEIKDSLIVTSIQKLSNINEIDFKKLKANDLSIIRNKRIVFIVDEAHRSQFGEMHTKVKNTFTNALFIGFTGTPIMTENDKEGNTTRTAFGDCLSIYSIADGIRDKNVLGFAPKLIKTYEDDDLRENVAFSQCNARTIEEIKKDPEKYKIYSNFKNNVPMASIKDENGKVIEKGIEDFISSAQYNRSEHRNAVVDDILKNWDVLSNGINGTKFHAILATNSIPEAIEYYHIFKKKKEDGLCDINTVALFDSHIDNSGEKSFIKQDALIEMLEDYNKQYGKNFNRETDPNLKLFKKDIINRLSHKEAYKNLKNHDDMIDIIIVVDQLLTGFDSQYVNTLYLDKVLEMDNLIQAISRTNRIYDSLEKPFGNFRFYRKPYTMEKNLKEALRLYCEGDTSVAEVASIDDNIETINKIFDDINYIFNRSQIKGFDRLPKSDEDCQKFKKDFSQLRILINSVKLQGMKWDNEYGKKITFTEETFNILKVKFEDLSYRKNNSSQNVNKIAYSINAILSEMEMERITANYLDSHFKKVIITFEDDDSTEDDLEAAIADFRNQLAKLSIIDKEYAEQIIEDLINRVLVIDKSKTLFQYINEYKEKDVNEKIEKESELFGLDSNLFKEIMKNKPQNERELNDKNKYSTLLGSCDVNKVIKYFSEQYGITLNKLNARGKLDKELKKFIYGEP